MSDPVNGMALTGVLVTVGQWSEGKSISPGIIIGGTVTALFLAAISEASPELASRMTWLIVIVSIFRYAPAILHKAGLIKDDTYKAAAKWG